MWIEKVPRRPDFCGQVGCPICYDWAEPSGETVPGYRHMMNELLGEAAARATREQTKAIEDAAERIHVSAVLAKVDPPPSIDGLAAEYDEAERARVDALQMKAFLANARREEEMTPTPPKRVLDHMTIPEPPAAPTRKSKSPNQLFPIVEANRDQMLSDYMRSDLDRFKQQYDPVYFDSTKKSPAELELKDEMAIRDQQDDIKRQKAKAGMYSSMYSYTGPRVK